VLFRVRVDRDFERPFFANYKAFFDPIAYSNTNPCQVLSGFSGLQTEDDLTLRAYLIIGRFLQNKFNEKIYLSGLLADSCDEKMAQRKRRK
jgi:hypothetical protein